MSRVAYGNPYFETEISGTGFLNDAFYVSSQYSFVGLKGALNTIYCWVSGDKNMWCRVVSYTTAVQEIFPFYLYSGGYWLRFECVSYSGAGKLAFYGGK